MITSSPKSISGYDTHPSGGPCTMSDRNSNSTGTLRSTTHSNQYQPNRAAPGLLCDKHQHTEWDNVGNDVQCLDDIERIILNRSTIPLTFICSAWTKANPTTSEPNQAPAAQANCGGCTHLLAKLQVLKARVDALERHNNQNGPSSAPALSAPDVGRPQSVEVPTNAPLYITSNTILDIDLANNSEFNPIDYQSTTQRLIFDVDANWEYGAHHNRGQDDDHLFKDIDFFSPSPSQDPGAQLSVELSAMDVDDILDLDFGSNTATAFPPAMTMSFQGIDTLASSDPASVLAVATALAAPAAAAPPRPRHQCAACSKSFSRAGDRDRHALTHNPHTRRYPCPDAGCRFSGMNGFVRKDKLREHRARHGH